jgi:glutathione synthase/RimK-type ligase-like ATP-grasp enzyme
VLQELDRIGEPATLLDLSQFPFHSRLSIGYSNREPALFHWSGAGPAIDFSQVKSIWWRRPQPFQHDPALTDAANMQFALSEASEAVSGLWHSLDSFWINDPHRDAAAHRKVYQLQVARQIGMPLPETLVTNDPERARQFIYQHEKVICKAFSATQTHWRETRLVTDQELANIDAVRFAPVIFQRYVEAVYDLRITVIGNQIFPAAIHSQQTEYKIDCRMDIGSAKIEPVTLPPQVMAQLRCLMKKLGLVYGAIDMRLQPDGTYVFLEINPAGQFLFIEAETRQPMARALAETLADPSRAL